MKFEEFEGTDDTGKLVRDGMKRTNVSDGTRRDANLDPVDNIRFESHKQERDYLVKLKKQLENEISNRYSRAAFSDAQAAVRRSYSSRPNASVMVWLQVRSNMERDKISLVTRIRGIDTRLMELRSLIHEEHEEESKNKSKEDKMSDFQRSVIDLLTEIRDMMRQR